MIQFLKRQIKRTFRPSLSLACDNLALSMLRPFDFGYLPWTAAAIRPASLCMLLNEIIINDRKKLIEFGSGISTLYMAHLLKQRGGQIVSIEHDRGWHGIVTTLLKQYDLQDSATCVLAPLKECPHSLDGCQWYDVGVVTQVLEGVQFDGVIVDGPPASSKGLELSRYPALPYVKSFLAENFFVYLDDIDRAGEKEIFGRWESLAGLQGSREMVAGNFGILRSSASFASVLANV